ncbi:TPA: YcaO-like family protein [Vibrio cholerae]|uniref:YcaO domain-containing protein n=1 Tax=Vibrio paracholerae TaxID=650003 RepID=A0ABD7FR83_9VIBR|nr:YcaO-like family protein [Vibrio paracholerae]RBM59501.1 hypothetical protein DLR72_18275 [Vibrio paracholerae]
MTVLESTLKKLVDFESGIISCIYDAPTQYCEPLIQIYMAEYSDPVVLEKKRVRNRFPAISRQASGAGLTRTEAIWSTIGEAIERYNSGIYEHLSQIVAVADDVAGGRDFLEKMIHFSEISYINGDVNYAKPDPNIERNWTEAKNILTGTSSYVPASLAFMRYNAPRQSDILDRTYSTGLACHSTYYDAALSGFCELIERDAYSCYWLTGMSPLCLSKEFVLKCLPIDFAEEINRLKVDYKVLALRTDLKTPVIVCVISVPGGGIASGASCNLNPQKALQKAIVEAFHTYNWCLDMKRLNKKIEDPSLIDDFRDHVAWYLDPERSKKYKWLNQDMVEIDRFPEDWISISTNDTPIKDQVEIIAQRISSAGFDPLLVDLTSPDIRDLGFYVVRAFAPGLQPLSSGYTKTHTDPRRLEGFLDWLGYTKSVTVSLYPPHSFP